jgi:hypothetical protein
MLNWRAHHSGALIPHIKEDGYALDVKCIPEKIFYNVVDGLRSLLNSRIDRNGRLSFDQFLVDMIIFFIFLFVLFDVFYYLPMEYLSNDPSKNVLFGQLFVIALLSSLLWAGYVYIIQSFKNLTRDKFLPAIHKIPNTIADYPAFFRQFFSGLRVEWNSGFGLNIYVRSSLIIWPLIFEEFYLMRDSLGGLIWGIFISHSVDSLISLYLSIAALSIVCTLAFMVFLAILTVPVIFFYLWITVRFLPVEINPFHDMGGTGPFGKIIVNCIYLVSLALGIIPLFPLLGKIDLSFLSHLSIPAENLGNTTTFIRADLVKSVSAIPVDTFSKYVGFIELYFGFILLAFLVILILHDRIKRRKEEVLSQLEQKISFIDFTNTENKENNLYYLDLYEKVSESSEWPIKKLFAIELIISILPLFISFFFP